MKRKLSKACSHRGSNMGRPTVIPAGILSQFAKLHLVRLQWVDYDYDTGGCYWGGGNQDFIYWAYNERMGIEIFVRAAFRSQAKAEVRELLPQARFFN